MGTVLKKTFTKPVPIDAEMFIRKGIQFARWKDGKDKTRTAKVTTGKDGSPLFTQQNLEAWLRGAPNSD